MSASFPTKRPPRRGNVSIPIRDRVKEHIIDPIKEQFRFVTRMWHNTKITPLMSRNLEFYGMVAFPIFILVVTLILMLLLLLWNQYSTTWGFIFGTVYLVSAAVHLIVFIAKYGVSESGQVFDLKYFEKTASHHIISRMVHYAVGFFGLGFVGIVLIAIAIDTDNLILIPTEALTVAVNGEIRKQDASLWLAVIVTFCYLCATFVNCGTMKWAQHHDKNPRVPVIKKK